MESPFPTVTVAEGAATLRVPKIELAEGEPLDHALSRAPVFYNPRMRLNRDTAVLAASVYQRRLAGPLSVCDPMCGTGVRGIRLALEAPGVVEVLLGDLNPRAVRLAAVNAALNKVPDRVRARLIEANLLLNLHDRGGLRFDYLDIDPYGSPAPFLDAAVRSVKEGGMIALTATDMAPLCGVNPKACLRKYGGAPLRGEFCHETALRLLAGALVRTAARFDTAASPVFGFAADHYARLYAVLERGARKADERMGEMGYIAHCPSCLNRKHVKRLRGDESACDVCGSRMAVGGSMWLGPLADGKFCWEMLELSWGMAGHDPRLQNLIELVREESDMPPSFFNIDSLCSRLRIDSLPIADVISGLVGSGFRATRTHFEERGVRTDASVKELRDILSAVAKARRRA